MDKQINYYELLDLTPGCRMEDIEKAYKIAKNTYGNQSPALYSLYQEDDNNDMLKKIEEAYSILSNPEKRKEYDRFKGFLKDVLNNPSQAFEDGKIKEIAQEESKYRSTLKSSNVSVSAYSSLKRYALDYTIDPDFEEKIEKTEKFSGEFLRQIREYKNVDIDRMVELTKVSKTKLTAIEMEHFDNLPARIYVRGYLYQYAKCLKLPIEKVITTYLENYPND